ncbi:MAG: ion transporter [Actinomycetes bacterium]
MPTTATMTSDQQRLETWELRTRPAIVAAAIAPLIGVTTGTAHIGAVGIAIEIVSWLVFLVDLIVHIRLKPGYLRTGIGRFDLAVVVLTSPWYLIPGAHGGEIVTVLRLARLARVVMVAVHAPRIRRTFSRLGRPVMYMAMAVFVCAGITMRAEHHQNGFKNYGASLWWGVVTVTTVGYGDIVPQTTVGRLAATVLMLVGIAMLGTVAASLAALFRLEDRDEGGAADGEADQRAPAAGDRSEVAGDVVAELRSLRSEVAALRQELGRPTP